MPLRALLLHSACVGTMALSGARPVGQPARVTAVARGGAVITGLNGKPPLSAIDAARHAATPAERAQLDRELLVGLRGEVRPIRDLVSRTGDVIRFGPHAFSPGHDYMAGLSVDAARVGDELQFHVREA
jgi:small ligand-binding sensory domain FIST